MEWCPECQKNYDSKDGICPVCGELLETEKASAAHKAVCSGDCSSCGSDCNTCGLAEPFDDEECTGNCDPGIWPLDDEGNPVKPVRILTVTGNQVDYEMTLAQLRSFGIPSAKDFPQGGQIAKVLFGFAGTGMDVYVPENMAELAKELLKPVEEDE